MGDQGLLRETAYATVDKPKRRNVTPLDLLDVMEKRIGEVDRYVSALPILCFDRARASAKALMQRGLTSAAYPQGSRRRSRT